MEPIYTFAITRKWFNMILSGEKTEEYRQMSPFYESRLRQYTGQVVTIRLRNGYATHCPSILCNCRVIRGRRGRTDWGAEKSEKYYVLKILAYEIETPIPAHGESRAART